MWGCVEIIFLLIRIYCGFYLWNFCKFQLKLKIKLLDDNGWHLPYTKKKRTSHLSVFVAVRLRGKLNIFSLWFRVYLVFVVFIYAVLWYTHHASSLHIVILRRMWLSVWRRQCTRLLINKFALRVWVCNIQPALQSTRRCNPRGFCEYEVIVNGGHVNVVMWVASYLLIWRMNGLMERFHTFFEDFLMLMLSVCGWFAFWFGMACDLTHSICDAWFLNVIQQTMRNAKGKVFNLIVGLGRNHQNIVLQEGGHWLRIYVSFANIFFGCCAIFYVVLYITIANYWAVFYVDEFCSCVMNNKTKWR